jgi:beta-glucosidase
VELYLGCPTGSVCFAPPTEPSSPVLLRELKGFKRVHVAPGETRHVTFVLTPRDLSQVTEQGEHIELPGHFAVIVGGGLAEGRHVTAEFDIAGSQVLPR